MLVPRSVRVALMGGSVVLAASPAIAGQAPPASPATQGSAKLVYTPADFARFAPKTAYDMLVQVPGFTIVSADQDNLDDGSKRPGLGEAFENVLINGKRVADRSGGAVSQLKRTSAATVDRIEIVDAASLGIAGLAG